ncbi:NAD(P)/FAD-dependent oxidoreductase [Pleurocapsa sp. PCC 7319]|uniref:dihydrolipoyl dehydrogenase family protein n=1 Tax=Pleurocapsa sp. PCC 7319 TaxID=118161 RepID=UPI000344E02E|nr:NAD(P)/FAD-dependent oxidoreductase [Pleurocapsa sp. PCC 7319]
MAVDYDLVVIGSSWAGIYAARNAVQLQARVALVTQCQNQYLPNDVLVNHSLSEIGRLNYQLANHPFAIASERQSPFISLQEASDWTKGINSRIKAENSLSSLAVLGVDVIVGKGQFFSLPKLGFQVGQRKLRSRHYLLATGSKFVPRLLDGNNTENYITLRDLWRINLGKLPQSIIIVGKDPISLELAQNLARFDKKVTLVVNQPRILPQEDLDIAILIQGQLEAEGIRILTEAKVSQIKIINEQKWLQAGDQALSADEIIFADCRQPNIEELNLASVEVKYDHCRVYVNKKLQTTNANIYACGDLIGGYCLPNIEQYEVNLILKNSLFSPWYKTNYFSLPWAILTDPNLVRIGLNEKQAQQQYGVNIYIIKQYFNDTDQARILDQNTGLCKLLVRENGVIVGCSLVGENAREFISAIALMMEHNIRLDNNPFRGLTEFSVSTIYPSFAEILQQASYNFYQQKLQRNPRRLNRLRIWSSLF